MAQVGCDGGLRDDGGPDYCALRFFLLKAWPHATTPESESVRRAKREASLWPSGEAPPYWDRPGRPQDGRTAYGGWPAKPRLTQRLGRACCITRAGAYRAMVRNVDMLDRAGGLGRLPPRQFRKLRAHVGHRLARWAEIASWDLSR